jgi:hypothetical protein
MAKNLYRRGSGPMWFVALAVVIFALYSLAMAASTADKCDASGAGKTWQVMPPHWECNGRNGFG